MIRKARKDANHSEIVATLSALGCTVVDLSAAGISGLPDLLVGVAGRTLLVEVKNRATRYGRAGLSKEQADFAQLWRGEPVAEVSSINEAIALVEAARAGR